MCEQTEINYLDGDIVWVKLGACWWPGQVTSFHNLPEDIQIEFQKKPLIAAVKFFQEDTYEFVKNLQQIYKYNCTQKDDFIRKGLDKYRTKSKDGSSYMDKFPGDVEMAEKLTGGDPDILTSDKFGREEKPDISALFGEKKIPKKKRDREEMSRRSSDGTTGLKKITHPRFLRESDHEIRIRQQPSSLASTPKTGSTDSPQYSCHLCNFTSTRVNVIICHRKSHCSEGGALESPLGRARVVSYTAPKSAARASFGGDSQKRKYVRKTKSLSSKVKSSENEPVKRKLSKQVEKTAAKKKKSDPELREKLLADWDDESDEDMADLETNKSTEAISEESPSLANNSASVNNRSERMKEKEDDDGSEILKASEKLLRETEKFAAVHTEDASPRSCRQSNKKHPEDLDSGTDTSSSTLTKEEKPPAYKKPKKLIASMEERKSSTGDEKDDKQSRFSCFDFDEDDVPEPTITPVRKMPRIFGEKNTSVKKEILKKFTLSQALKSAGSKNEGKDERAIENKISTSTQDFFDNKEPTAKEKQAEKLPEQKNTLGDRLSVKESKKREIEAKSDVEATKSQAEEGEPREKMTKPVTVTELEIVEIFEVEGEKDDREESTEIPKKLTNFEIETLSLGNLEKKTENQAKNDEKKEDFLRKEKTCPPEKEETMSELATTETEDETISEVADSFRGNSENSDTDGNTVQAAWSLASSGRPKSCPEDEKASEKPTPRRRGRPRKSLPAVGDSSGANDSPKHEIVGKKVAALASRESERKTSESDSERSYTGRRRKPNKKYLHSEVYTSSPDTRASKTDDSQSETEEKSHKEHKVNKTRRGKKKPSLGSSEGHVESLQNKNAEHEFEFSNRTLDTADAGASKSQERVSRVNEIFEIKTESMETTESGSNLPDSIKKFDLPIGSPGHGAKFLPPVDSDSGSTKNNQGQGQAIRNEKPNESKDKSDKAGDSETHANDAKPATKFDPVRSNVDKLPPKKSQIKKFELSQIDLLDACEEQVAAEQAAAEKRTAADKLAAEKLAAEKLAVEKLAAEKLAAEKLAEEKLAAEKLAAEKLAAEKLAAEKLAAEKLAAEKLAAEKLAEEKRASEKAAAEKLAMERAAAAAEKAEAERQAREEEEKKKKKKEEEKKQALEKKAVEEARMVEEKLKAEASAEKTKLQSAMSDNSSEQSEKVSEQVPATKDKVVSPAVPAEKSRDEALGSDSAMETIEAVLARITNDPTPAPTPISTEVKTSEAAAAAAGSEVTKTEKNAAKQANQTGLENAAPQRSSPQAARPKGKATPENSKLKKTSVIDEEIPINSFQEAFLKTLHIDKKDEKEGEASGEVAGGKAKQQAVGSVEKVGSQQTIVIAIAGSKAESVAASGPPSQEAEKVEPLNAMTEFEGVEILVQENMAQVEPKGPEEENSQNQMDLAATLVGTDVKSEVSNALSLDLQKIQDTLSDRVSTPSPSSEASVPVKKREKPRIIENVALKEPMQILKNKLLEKLPMKSTKHKLDVEGQKKSGDSKGGGAPRAKIMKIDAASGNSKSRSPGKSGGSHFTITRKLQVLKAEEAATAAAIEKEKAQAKLAQTMALPSGGEKFIQQSSQGLADMELDINSMPFVLSEDVLTPESIDQMPVVLSSIIPSSSSPATSQTSCHSLTTSTQVQTSNSEILYKSTSSGTSGTTTTTMTTMTTTESVTPTGKKKSGTPAILKNKAKAKPTITSIKTLVPPFTGGGVKGLKFQSQQSTSGKAMPLVSPKNTTPGKYVIVQTAGGQQMRYSVQGKAGSQHKIAIPAGKATGSAQIVSQGGKVVILTSAQSGQTKMLPLNIAKSMTGKVQKIVNNKGQIYAPISPQGIIGQNAIIAPKSDTNSPTTSKLVQGQKIMNAQGIITSKGVLTPISTSKSTLLGTLSPRIITKGGIYTPISSAQLTGKTIIGGKTLVSSKAATILSPLGSQTLGTSKGTIIAPMSHAIAGKTIINAQGIATSKGTVLTPITGQQVKAIAAKSPAKGAKIHYQAFQQKAQLPMLQKCQKIAVPSSPQMRPAGSVKSPGSTIVFQNAVAGVQKTPSPAGKKMVRQIGQQTIRSPQTTTMTTPTTNVSVQQQVLQRGKSLTAATATATTVQRVATPRSGARQTKPKIVVQKISDAMPIDGNSSTSPLTNAQTHKPIMSPTVVGNVVKTPTTLKQASRTPKSGRNMQKNLLNVSSSSTSSPSLVSSETLLAGSAPIQSAQSTAASQSLQNLSVPPLVLPGTELPITESEPAEKSLGLLGKESSKKQEPIKTSEPTIEEPKLEAAKVQSTAQPQIMALPTESSDGTQTYVLVTIDEQGQIQPLDNNTLMSLEGTTQNADGTRTLYIDPSSLGDAGTLDNLVIQFDNAALPNLQTSGSETSQNVVAPETFPSTEIIQTSNQDILAAALANTDFQQEIGLPDNATSTVMSTSALTQTSLINQTILQSTIIPPTEPISSPSVLETSLTLNQPIMTPLEVPSSLPIQIEATPASVVSTIPTSLELPITITDPTISYISTAAAAAAAAGAAVATTPPSERHIQIPGNSMPDIGEIMESSSSAEIVHNDVPTSTRYLVLPAIDESMTTIQSQESEPGQSGSSATYSVSIPDNMVIDNSTGQTTPSMPIIDDGYVEGAEQRFSEVTINEMLVPRVSEAGGMLGTGEKNEPIPKQAEETSIESQVKIDQEKEAAAIVSQVDSFVAQEAVVGMNVQEVAEKVSTAEKQIESSVAMEIDEQSPRVITPSCSSPVMAESCSTEMQVEAEPKKMIIESPEEVRDSGRTGNDAEEAMATNTMELSSLMVESHGNSVQGTGFVNHQELNSSSENVARASGSMQLNEENVVVEEAVEMEIYPSETPEAPDGGQETVGASSQVDDSVQQTASDKVNQPGNVTEASQQEEAPSQSYEQFNASERVTSDSTETPSQSVPKSENSREATQSVAYEAMEVDETTVTGEPPTQSFEDTKRNEASQSYEPAVELNTNAPTQSFNEVMQCQQQQQHQQQQQQQHHHQQEEQVEEPSTAGDAIDDQSFPTQSYEVGKMDNLSENLESDASSAIGQEGNIPSQSNDIGNDGIGTSSVSVNNSGMNEDETASSSYVPETPENQERDQDQESAISTSSYEIPPCEELNIASSSVIPDTSVRGEHMSIHDNGVPEIPTSSYNLNPDSSSTSHVDTLPTSSYEEDRVIVEQNVSTSYEVPISMPGSGIEENSSQNFVTESTDHRDEPSSYYARHPEVSASYYEAANQDSNSRLEADPQEEVTPSYYEQPQDITSEASQSYFRPTPRYSSQSVSPSYYDPTPETEASQSSYYSHEIEATEQSSSRNVEASQSFYQETTDERRLRQQGEATPTYTERYSSDYALASSPIERHDLVESSVPATRPTERDDRA